MTLLTFHEILDAAKRLPYEDQAVLIAQLQKRSKPPSARRNNASREQVLAEFERRKRMGAFDQVESLRGAFAHPAQGLLVGLIPHY